MANGVPFSVTFRDHKNQVSSLRGLVAVTGGALYDVQVLAVKTAAAALSNASARANTERVGPVTSGTSAEYDTVEDKAVIAFQTAAGSIHRYSIPAPKASIFLADAETVDFSNADVASFVTAVTGNMVSREGAALTASIGGYRIRSRAQRKFNIYTRNPALTGQGL